MKKMILFAMGMIFAMAGFAQFSFGVQATGNLSSARLKTETAADITRKMKVTPGVGIVAQYDLSHKMAIRSGINYLQHGITINTALNEPANLRVKAENKLHYLQVPVNVLYQFPAGNKKLYAGAGGYVSYGISGQTKLTTRLTLPNGNESVTVEKLKAFKKEEQDGAGLKRFDAGVGALAGIRFDNGLFTNLGYQYSLTNSSEAESGGKYKNRGVQLSVGYFF